MEWVLYALLGALLATQVILILMAAERRAMLVEIVGAINSGQARWDELQSIRKLLEDQTRYFIED